MRAHATSLSSTVSFRLLLGQPTTKLLSAIQVQALGSLKELPRFRSGMLSISKCIACGLSSSFLHATPTASSSVHIPPPFQRLPRLPAIEELDLTFNGIANMDGFERLRKTPLKSLTLALNPITFTLNYRQRFVPFSCCPVFRLEAVHETLRTFSLAEVYPVTMTYRTFEERHVKMVSREFHPLLVRVLQGVCCVAKSAVFGRDWQTTRRCCLGG